METPDFIPYVEITEEEFCELLNTEGMFLHSPETVNNVSTYHYSSSTQPRLFLKKECGVFSTKFFKKERP